MTSRRRQSAKITHSVL